MAGLKLLLVFAVSRVILGEGVVFECLILMCMLLGELVVVILTQQNQFHSTKVQVWRNELSSQV